MPIPTNETYLYFFGSLVGELIEARPHMIRLSSSPVSPRFFRASKVTRPTRYIQIKMFSYSLNMQSRPRAYLPVGNRTLALLRPSLALALDNHYSACFVPGIIYGSQRNRICFQVVFGVRLRYGTFQSYHNLGPLKNAICIECTKYFSISLNCIYLY